MEAVALLLLLLHAAPLEPPDPRDVAFPHGYRPSDADRRLVAPAAAKLMAGMGGRHSMDNNDPDVLRAAQWAAAHLIGTECVRRAFPSASKARAPAACTELPELTRPDVHRWS